ncbi:MAG: biosynthetic-type acetolactate synthase large subunit [Lentilactobacillus hilgardii]|uniref:biosynthetic-type acetolactate synthase large subunit n=1 Tax=Lentilactobacillus hilgardii TaxID=1588 RepID=UPI001CC218F9|nr:biosynthetic-type acetolactate synthase large subunit [Lentilactobacillus hilgardii]MBZ2202109.1 acetolactate synthase, large subunit, biosynthetic type [Lentilactobacillus hilgardii]MBZ2205087.1 acetolactate synthase, large subunit, biosynthetic type [Lentilactobacillus hilgardii]
MLAEESKPATATETGAEILVDALAEQNVDFLFGYPGGAVLPLYDALYTKSFSNVLTRHEQGAVHAAEGYAKTTGKTGVVCVTSGPGAGNVVTGIADAQMDSVPLVVFTGQVTRSAIGTNAFQELDIVSVTKPITKANFQVQDVNDLHSVVTKAFEIAQSGRKGPVLVDLPKDVTSESAIFEQNAPTKRAKQPQQLGKTQEATIEAALHALSSASKPVVIVGAGVAAAGATKAFNQFVHDWNIPVVATLLGLGILPSKDPLFLGMGGMHGSYAANMALAESDYILNIGSRFDDRMVPKASDFADNKTIVHIDIDTHELNKILKADYSIEADAKAALTEMNRSTAAKTQTPAWNQLVEDRKDENPEDAKPAAGQFNPHEVIEAVGKATNGDAIVVTDVGQHQMWAAQSYPFKHARQLVTSGGLGTMGYGLPAAIGAKLGNRDRDVVLFVGDGGFQMTSEELEVLAAEDLNVKIFLLNNHALGMIRQWQDAFYSNHRSKSLFDHQPDFKKLADAYDINYQQLNPEEPLEQQLNDVFDDPKSTLVEVQVPVDEQVYPMVAPGHKNNDMIGF